TGWVQAVRVWDACSPAAGALLRRGAASQVGLLVPPAAPFARRAAPPAPPFTAGDLRSGATSSPIRIRVRLGDRGRRRLAPATPADGQEWRPRNRRITLQAVSKHPEAVHAGGLRPSRRADCWRLHARIAPRRTAAGMRLVHPHPRSLRTSRRP